MATQTCNYTITNLQKYVQQSILAFVYVDKRVGESDFDAPKTNPQCVLSGNKREQIVTFCVEVSKPMNKYIS